MGTGLWDDPLPVAQVTIQRDGSFGDAVYMRDLHMIHRAALAFLESRRQLVVIIRRCLTADDSDEYFATLLAVERQILMFGLNN